MNNNKERDSSKTREMDVIRDTDITGFTADALQIYKENDKWIRTIVLLFLSYNSRLIHSILIHFLFLPFDIHSLVFFSPHADALQRLPPLNKTNKKEKKKDPEEYKYLYIIFVFLLSIIRSLTQSWASLSSTAVGGTKNSWVLSRVHWGNARRVLGTVNSIYLPV